MTLPRNMSPGDRIRLVTLEAELDDGSNATVILRYPWPDAMPQHSCVAELCEKCSTSAERVITRRLENTGAGKTTIAVLRLVRDRQTVAR